MNFKEAIKQAQEIAQHGTVEEKENFVNWVFYMLDYLSNQYAITGYSADKKRLSVVKAQYNAYLKALN